MSNGPSFELYEHACASAQLLQLFREETPAQGEFTHARLRATLAYAHKAYNDRKFDDATLWAIRSFTDGATRDAFLILARVARESDDPVNALKWYRAGQSVQTFTTAAIAVDTRFNNVVAQIAACERELQEQWRNRAPVEALLQRKRGHLMCMPTIESALQLAHDSGFDVVASTSENVPKQILTTHVPESVVFLAWDCTLQLPKMTELNNVLHMFKLATNNAETICDAQTFTVPARLAATCKTFKDLIAAGPFWGAVALP